MISLDIDIQDWEDYSQYRQLLKAAGYSIKDAVEGVDKVQRRLKKRCIKRSEHAYTIGQIRRSQTPGGLAVIFDPDDRALAAMPAYHRYVAYLISEYDNKDAAKILGISRTTLWRWLKKNGWTLKKGYTEGRTGLRSSDKSDH